MQLLVPQEGKNGSLGPFVVTYGRYESPAQQWIQAVVLGVFFTLFIAPAFGFPILSQGPNYLLFAGVVVLVAALTAFSIKKLRKNNAVKVHDQGVVLLRGSAERVILFSEMRSLRYNRLRSRLIIEMADKTEVDLPLTAGQGAAVIRSVEAQLGLPSPAPVVQNRPSTTPA